MHRVIRPGGFFVVVVPSYKDSPQGCMTRQTAVNAFQPPFEVLSVTDVGGVDQGIRYRFSIMMRRP